MSERLRIYAPDECGPDGYPLAWHGKDGGEPIKDLIRDLADHRCVRCGHSYRKGKHGSGEWSPCDRDCTHGAPYRLLVHDVGTMTVEEDEPERGIQQWLSQGPVFARWRILTVHHLTGDWANAKEAKRDCRWWNLAALCQRCHLTIQGKVQMDRPWPWDHSEWMKPYVAGFYATKYGGNDLTREQTEARLEELLDLGKREEAVERMPVGVDVRTVKR